VKLGFAVVLLMAVASVATHFLLQDNGYVLINFRGYAIEMSLPILLFLLILLYVAVRALLRLWRAPRELGAAAARARTRRAGRQVTAGFAALSAGKISKGERLITRAARGSETPLLNYLVAARAAQMQGDHERRDGWLRMAYEQGADSNNAVMLTQAELQLEDGEIEAAMASLSRIRERQPEHPQALKLLARIHRQREDWPALADLIPQLRRAGNLGQGRLEALTIETYVQLLGQPEIDGVKIEKLWQALPRPLRKSQELVRSRIRALVDCGARDVAEAEIRRALKISWDEDLVLLYGEIDAPDAAAQLRHAEGWLKARPEDSALLLTAGRACVRNQLWGKARSYLESSLAIRPSPAGYDALGRLMLHIGEADSASDAFQKGLTLSYAGTPGLPQLESKP